MGLLESLLFALILVLIARGLPVWLARGSLNHDSYFYLLYARMIRQSFGGQMRSVFLDDQDVNPNLLPSFLALFPFRLHLPLAKMLPVLLEYGNAAIFVLFLFLVGIPAHPLLIALWVFAPLTTSLYPGPRTYKFTPRLFSEFLFNATMLCFTAGSAGLYLAGVVIGGLVLLANYFGIQVLFLVFVPLGLSLLSPLAVLLPFLSCLAAALIHRPFLRILRFHLGYMAIYRKNFQYNHPLILARARWKLAVLRQEGPRRFLAALLLESDLFNFFVKNSFGLVAMALWFSGRAPDAPLLVAWLLIGQALFLLTSTRHLRFLGESERYLFYSGIPAIILLAFAPEPLLWTLLAFGLLYWCAMLVAIRMREQDPARSNRAQDEEEIARFMKRHHCKNALPIQYNPPWRIMYLTGLRFTGFFDVNAHTPSFYRKVWLPSKKVNLLAKKYGFRHVLLHRDYEREYRRALSGWHLLKQNATYALYERRASQGA